ncbi:hypothetical protein [Clostridioides difficile]|uniref:hypothetical protein n=1 Tax=Clostridioides difficile TaxID=1496 RepID=UPI0020B3778A|nr:hypothetical protein [Clostridioides difficile]MDM9773643.1 hypothetical protein [Clostridioides difficile]
MFDIFNKKYGRNVKITEAEPPCPPPKQPNFDMDNIQYDKEKERKLLEMEKIKIDSEMKKIVKNGFGLKDIRVQIEI